MLSHLSLFHTIKYTCTCIRLWKYYYIIKFLFTKWLIQKTMIDEKKEKHDDDDDGD